MATLNVSPFASFCIRWGQGRGGTRNTAGGLWGAEDGAKDERVVNQRPLNIQEVAVGHAECCWC